MEYSSLDVPSRCSRSGKTIAFVALVIGLGGVALYEFNSTSVATSTDLLAMPALSRSPTLASLPGPRKWKELALAAMEANNRCEVGGPKPTPRFIAALANMRSQDIEIPLGRKAKVTPPRFTAAQAGAKDTYVADDRVGAFPPLGFWDPWGLSTECTEGQLAYIREAELKHGRICMLATLGIFVAEKWHPLFGGAIDGTALQAIGRVELNQFWPAVLLATGGIEFLTSVGRADSIDDSGDRSDIARNTPELKPGLTPGDIGFDPFDLMRKNGEVEGYKMQERELAHARLAMISALGMLAQELAFPDVKIAYAPGVGA